MPQALTISFLFVLIFSFLLHFRPHTNMIVNDITKYQHSYMEGNLTCSHH